jgi:hypothetical protein
MPNLHYVLFKKKNDKYCSLSNGLKGLHFFKYTKILSQRHLFLSFLPSPFLPCKATFMNDYDGI